MESEKIYEESHKELLKLKRNIGTDQIVINMKLLDGETKNRIKRIHTKRKSHISDVYERRIQNGFKQSKKDRYKNESRQRKIDRNFYWQNLPLRRPPENNL